MATWNLEYLTTHFLPDVQLAVGQLAHHKMRSALTLLGMVFGVGAVIAMLAVSEGGRIQAMQMIEGMGVRNLIVESAPPSDASLRDVRQLSPGLSISDAKAIDSTLPFVESWAATRRIPVWNLFSHEGQSSVEVWAVSPSYFEMTNLVLSSGEVFSEEDDEQFVQKAVLGSTATKELFPNGDAVGKRIKVNHLWLEVVGILTDKQLPGEEFQGEEIGSDSDRVYIPLQTGLKRLPRHDLDAELSSLKIQIADGLSPSVAAKAIQHLINRRHASQQDTRMVIPARLLAQQRNTQRIFTIVMSAVAGISLLVGGIGIMNIMLASVLERKSEIGLLRAVGARKIDVVRQFLVETAIISLVGALAGVVIGIIIAYIIAGFSGWAVAWSVPIIALAVGVCITIAVGFGVYPAMAAAGLDPVVALQTE